MKKLSKYLCFLMVFILWISATISVSAATPVSRDGLEITMETDKSQYETSDKITATITVKNTNSFGVNNVSLECAIPEGYAAEGDSTLTIATLASNETKTLQVVLAPNTSGEEGGGETGGETGDGGETGGDTEESTIKAEAYIKELKSQCETETFTNEEVTNSIQTLTEKRIEEIRNTPTTVEVTGTKYYVAADGDDNNDGLSPDKPWKTLQKASSTTLKHGDGVFFKRGDIFTGTLNTQMGVTYSAYGEGEKPRLYASEENSANPDFWEETEVENVWLYKGVYAGENLFTNKLLGWQNDIGNIVFDGTSNARKVYRSDEADGTHLDRYTKRPFDSYKDLTDDLSFYHDNVEGKVYLKCDAGNPGEIYSEIRLVPWKDCIANNKNNSVTIDNLHLAYGRFGVSAVSVNNLTIQNCEINWIGGNLYEESPQRGFGNGIEIYGNATNHTVNNCYIWQVYDAAMTIQKGAVCTVENVQYTNNVVENAVYAIEIFYGEGSTFDNVSIKNNLLRMAGGFGSVSRPDQGVDALIRHGVMTKDVENYVVQNNIFDRSVSKIIQAQADGGSFAMYHDNIYVQHEGLLFANRFGKAYYMNADLEESIVATGTEFNPTFIILSEAGEITPTATPVAPTATPVAPTEAPTSAPTVEPTSAPTEVPTSAPTEAPTAEPTGGENEDSGEAGDSGENGDSGATEAGDATEDSTKTGTALAPSTGDSNNMLFWSMIIILAALFMGIGYVKFGKNRKGLFAMFLGASIVLSSLSMGKLEVAAEDAPETTKTVTVETSVTVGTEQLTITGKVTYDTIEEEAFELPAEATTAEAYISALKSQSATLSDNSVTDGIQMISEKRIEEIKNTPTTIVVGEGATAYYVAADGDDNNAGTSADTPWKSIEKVNDATLNNGDVVFFKRGDTFTGTLNAKAGVTYSAYDEGAKPKICAHAETTAVSSLANIGVSVAGVQNVTIDNLHISYAKWGIYDNNAPTLTVQNCEFSLIRENGIEFYRNASNSTVDNCYFGQIYNVAIYIQDSGSDTSQSADNVSLTNNVVEKTEKGIHLKYYTKDKPRAISNLLIANNILRMAGGHDGSISKTTDKFLFINGNLPKGATNCVVQNNIFDRGETMIIKVVQPDDDAAGGLVTYTGNIYVQMKELQFANYMGSAIIANDNNATAWKAQFEADATFILVDELGY